MPTLRRTRYGTISALLLLLGASWTVGAAPAAAACAGLASDFDHDENADVAIGEPYRDAGGRGSSGAVHIMYGADDGLSAADYGYFDQDTPGLGTSTASNNRFGLVVASGDFDGDCHADLAVGTSGDPSEGLAILYGSPTGLVTAGSQVFAQRATTLISGDFDGDGADDLALAYAEQIHIYEGASGGALTLVSTLDQDSPGVPGGNEPGDHFGDALAAADFNADGHDDLAIGAWAEDVGSSAAKRNAGSVTILLGSASGITTSGAQAWTQDSPGIPGSAEVDEFGKALAAADFNNDGKADLAIGVPNESIGNDPRTGMVTVLRGAAAGLTSSGVESFHQDTSGVPGSNEVGDAFGYALAAGEFDGDGYVDLAVGAQFEDIGSDVNAGSVTVLYSKGPSGGLSGSGAKAFTQETSGISGSAEDGDLFGASLRAARVTGQGREDLIIGVWEEDTGDRKDDGMIQLLLSSGNGITTSGSETWTMETIDGSGQDEGQFGRALS